MLLIASAAVVLIVSIGGWDTIEGAKPIQLAFIALYLVFALFVARWSRGVLPMIAGLAIILGIFGAVAAPAWFDRDKDGFTDPALAAGVLGLFCALLVAAADRADVERDDRLPAALERRGRAPRETASRRPPRLAQPPAQVEERQTRRSQKPLPLRACGFESRPGHFRLGSRNGILPRPLRPALPLLETALLEVLNGLQNQRPSGLGPCSRRGRRAR